MTIECKKDAPVNWIHVFLHERCVVVTFKKNVLYEFTDGQKLLDDLAMYLEPFKVTRVREFLELNSPKMKFPEKNSGPNQLSLF